jgi:hypothetical protein
MNEFNFIFQKICRRRGFTFQRADLVACATRVDFGLANNTALYAAVANTFYYALTLNCMTHVAQTGNAIQLQITNLGGGSAGNLYLDTSLTLRTMVSYTNVEFDSMLYIVNGNTAGSVVLTGQVFKILYN